MQRIFLDQHRFYDFCQNLLYEKMFKIINDKQEDPQDKQINIQNESYSNSEVLFDLVANILESSSKAKLKDLKEKIEQLFKNGKGQIDKKKELSFAFAHTFAICNYNVI